MTDLAVYPILGVFVILFHASPWVVNFGGKFKSRRSKGKTITTFWSNSDILGQDDVIGAGLNHQRPTIASSITLRQTGLAILWGIIQIIKFIENILKDKDLVISRYVK